MTGFQFMFAAIAAVSLLALVALAAVGLYDRRVRRRRDD